MAVPFSPGANVCAYLRDSGHEDQDLSVDQQESSIRAWCLGHHLILTHIYTDAAAPGSTTIGRNAFQDMIQHFRQPDCPDAGVLVWKYNRFARDLDDAQFYKADLRRRGFIIHSLNDQVPEGLDGRFFEAAIDWMNARYLDDLRTDVKRGQHHLLTQYGGIGGRPPKGFIREPIQIDARRDGSPHIIHRWAPDPQTWDLCRLAWSMRASGKSYTEIDAETHLFTSKNSYTSFFANRLYLGELVFEDILIPDYVPALIDRPTWDAVQAIHAKNQKTHGLRGEMNPTHPRRANSNFLLSGLACCAQCGAPLNGNVVAFHQTPGYHYEYYVCSASIRRHNCTAKKIPRKGLEIAVIATLKDFILHPQNIAAKQNIIENDQVNDKAKTAAARRDLKKRLTSVQRKIHNLTEVIADKGRSALSLTEKLIDLEHEQTTLQTALSVAAIPTQTIPLVEAQELANRVKYLLADETNLPKLRTVLRGIVHKITVERDPAEHLIRGVVSYYYPPKIDLDHPVLPEGDPSPDFMPKPSFPPGTP
jgi:DNA invertase Pin-like site-specific DNA recombinase